MPSDLGLMILGNMHANGAQTLAAWCLGRGCNHHFILDVSGYPQSTHDRGYAAIAFSRPTETQFLF